MIRIPPRIMAYTLVLALLGCAGSPQPRDSESAPTQTTEAPSPTQPSLAAENTDTVSSNGSDEASGEVEKVESPVADESPTKPSIPDQPGEAAAADEAMSTEPPDLTVKPAEAVPPLPLTSLQDDVFAVEPAVPPEPTEPTNDGVQETEDRIEVDESISSEAPQTPPPNPLLTEDRPYPAEIPTKPLTAKPSEPVNDADVKVPSRTVPETEAPAAGIQPDEEGDAVGAPEQPPEAVPSIRVPDRTVRNEDAPVNDSVPAQPSIEDMEEAAVAPSRQLDGPGESSIVLDGRGWVFRSDLSTPGAWRFLAREREGDSTRFRFLFDETGRWTMVFERQDLSSGGSEQAVRSVVVGEDGGPAVSLGPPVQGEESAISGTLPMSPEDRNSAAEEAIARGRIAEALQLWEVDAPRDDAAGQRARSAIMTHASRAGAVGPLVTWLPKYLSDNPDPDVLAESLRVFEGEAGYERETITILENLVGGDVEKNRAEWLYRLAYQLEQPGEYRHLDRAAALYSEVIDQWPLTTWRNLSEERLNGLKRYYFRVR